MNPYAYSRNQQAHPNPPAPVPAPTDPSMGGLVKSVFTSVISPAIALAIVVFAAGSAGAVTWLAYSEMSQPSELAIAHNYNQPQVLGDSTSASGLTTIDDSALESGSIVYGRLSAKAVNYDSSLGRWNYSISYILPKFDGSAVLSIGTYTLQSGITASGTVQTGAILKPGKVYHVTLWISDANGNKINAVRYELKTQKAPKTSSGDSNKQIVCGPLLPPQSNAVNALSASSSPAAVNLCIKKDDGKTSCTQSLCRPPQEMGMMEHGIFSSTTPLRIMHPSSTPEDNSRSGGQPPRPEASASPERQDN